MRLLFAATERQLARDRALKHALLLPIPLLLAGAWIGWLFLSRITVNTNTEQARIEVAQAAYVVQARVSGRVVRSNLELGRQVELGSVLIELEADPQKFRVREEQTRRQSLQVELANLRSELVAQQQSRDAEGAAGEFATKQARASLVQAKATADFTREEYRRRAELYKQGLIAEIDYLRFESEAKKKDSELQSFDTAVSRAEREQSLHGSERQARIEAIQRDIGRILGELANSGNVVDRLQHELGWQKVLAPGPGRLGEAVSLKPGAYVREGDRLAAIVPDGKLRVVAYFEPRNVIGRVRPGQTGRLRLDGFPWAEYGSILATVTGVGDEVRDGRVRVELDAQPQSRIPLQHGLPGTLEIQVERISPAVFLMRKAGGYLAQPANLQVATR